jgi:hypothetical protein
VYLRALWPAALRSIFEYFPEAAVTGFSTCTWAAHKLHNVMAMVVADLACAGVLRRKRVRLLDGPCRCSLNRVLQVYGNGPRCAKLRQRCPFHEVEAPGSGHSIEPPYRVAFPAALLASRTVPWAT